MKLSRIAAFAAIVALAVGQAVAFEFSRRRHAQRIVGQLDRLQESTQAWVGLLAEATSPPHEDAA